MELQELMEHFFHLYGLRNQIFLANLRKRIDFLGLAIGDLQDAIRKEIDKKKIEIALARVVSRIFCIAGNFTKLPVVEMMASKYPLNWCSYCQSFPCECTERRPAAQLQIQPSEAQRHWNLKKWCSHLDNLYGEKNKEKGVENILNRLFKEVYELISLQLKTLHPHEKHKSLSLEEIRRGYALELTDALAWTIAIANFLEIDLEKAVWDRYGEGCWNCRQIPCICTTFSFEPVDWEEVE